MIDYTKNDIYKMNKSKEQDKDFICVQGWDIGTPNKKYINIWREHFDKLFNEDSKNFSIKLNISSDDLNSYFVCVIQEFEVKDDLKRDGSKVTDPNGVLLKYEEVLKS
jgi:hypothetical protein